MVQNYYKETLEEDANKLARSLEEKLGEVEDGELNKEDFPEVLRVELLNYREKHLQGDPRNAPKVKQPPKEVMFVERMTIVYKQYVEKELGEDEEYVVTSIKYEVHRYLGK